MLVIEHFKPFVNGIRISPSVPLTIRAAKPDVDWRLYRTRDHLPDLTSAVDRRIDVSIWIRNYQIFSQPHSLSRTQSAHVFLYRICPNQFPFSFHLRERLSNGLTAVSQGPVRWSSGTESRIFRVRIFTLFASSLPAANIRPSMSRLQLRALGAVFVNSSGQITFKGALPDGTRLSQSASLSQDGEWPFYVSLNRGGGAVIGWLNLEAANDLNGQLTWIKLESSAKYYPGGFKLQIPATGSAYQPPLSFTEGTLTLNGGNLSAPVVYDITLNNGRASNQSGGRFSLRFSASTGLFSGSASPGGRTVRFSGVILQDQNSGSGYFLGTDQSGRVSLTPR